MQFQSVSTKNTSPSSFDPSAKYLAGQAAPKPATPPPSTSTILFAEDDEDLLQLTRAFLKSSGYNVLSCSNGRTAAEVFRRAPRIDLLLTDLRMPGLSGLELARELTSLRPDLPVLMISGNSLTEELAGEIAGNGWYFLPKPWRVPDLLTAVHRLLGSPVACEHE